MQKHFTLLLFVLFYAPQGISQADSLNQLEEDGKKTGWWLTYLDENLEVLEDSVGATHCMYNYFWRNKFSYRFGEGYGSKKYPMQYPENDTITIGDYILLNGKYITKFDNGNKRSVLTASKGYMTNFKVFFPSGQLKFEIVVSDKCGEPTRHCLTEYKKGGSLKYEGFTWFPKQAK